MFWVRQITRIHPGRGQALYGQVVHYGGDRYYGEPVPFYSEPEVPVGSNPVIDVVIQTPTYTIETTPTTTFTPE